MALASLPIELWRRIIQEATSPPGGLVTSWLYAPSEKLFRGWEDLDFEDLEIQTKLSVVLVSRQWHTIGIEFLYQWIRLRTPASARALADIFRASARTSSESQPRYGWWVKRLDVVNVLTGEENMDTLFEFLELCSRVEAVFHLPPFGAISDERSVRLAHFKVSHFQSSLCHVVVRTSRPSTVAPQPPPMTLKSLASLSLAISDSRSTGQVIPDWHLPALRFLKLFQLRSTVVPCLLPFLDRYGPQLVGLHLRTRGQLDLDSLPAILTRTTSLRSIVLDEVDLSALHTTELSYPSILYLGIQLGGSDVIGEPHAVSFVTEPVEALLMKRILPGLKSIQLLRLEDSEQFEETWATLLGLCRSHKVALRGMR